MLISIEVWDFESHEHTLVDGLSSGLNLICGPSNAGKSSLVRALELAAYNKFDPKALRIGAKQCKVRITSDKGVVQVTRGPKDNFWEITENGQPTKSFDKVGVKPVPEACRILGLGIVRLGDTDVPVNIMDQLESHFMLAGIGDEKATGSVRAQIVDEISGLSGIEGVIKSVSLDNTRFGRKIKQLEDEIKSTQNQLHDQELLDTESKILTKAEKLLQERDDFLLASSAAESVVQESNDVSEKIRQLEAKLLVIPDVEKVVSFLDLAKDGMDVVLEGGNLIGEIKSVRISDSNLSVELGRIGDVERAESCIIKSDSAVSRSQDMRRILDERNGMTSRLHDLTTRLDSLPDESLAQNSMDKCLETAKNVEAMRELLDTGLELGGHKEVLKKQVKDNDKLLVQATEERDNIMKSVTICPINLGPVSSECLKEKK